MNIHPNGHTSSIQEFGGPFLGNIAWHDVKKSVAEVLVARIHAVYSCRLLPFK